MLSFLRKIILKKSLPYEIFCSRNYRKTSANESETRWFPNLFVRKIDPGTDSHSRLLSDSDAVYEFQFHSVKPGSMEEYLKNCEILAKEFSSRVAGYKLIGSFRVLIGHQDQIVNLWKFDGGYPVASVVQHLSMTDATLCSLNNEQSKLLTRRQNEFTMAFSFWKPPEPAERNCYYEMRSYLLKPGTMIEWGNSWAQGINFRQNKVAGFFSQIGQLYTVHHIWHYKDLQNRKEVREDAWSKPGWDEIVGTTVPLIREMRSRWMIGNSFSPIR